MVTIGTLLVTDEHQANPAIHLTCAKSRAGPVILNVKWRLFRSGYYRFGSVVSFRRIGKLPFNLIFSGTAVDRHFAARHYPTRQLQQWPNCNLNADSGERPAWDDKAVVTGPGNIVKRQRIAIARTPKFRADE